MGSKKWSTKTTLLNVVRLFRRLELPFFLIGDTAMDAAGGSVKETSHLTLGMLQEVLAARTRGISLAMENIGFSHVAASGGVTSRITGFRDKTYLAVSGYAKWKNQRFTVFGHTGDAIVYDARDIETSRSVLVSGMLLPVCCSPWEYVSDYVDKEKVPSNLLEL